MEVGWLGAASADLSLRARPVPPYFSIFLHIHEKGCPFINSLETALEYIRNDILPPPMPAVTNLHQTLHRIQEKHEYDPRIKKECWILDRVAMCWFLSPRSSKTG